MMKGALPESSQSSFEIPPLPSAKTKTVSILSHSITLNPTGFSTPLKPMLCKFRGNPLPPFVQTDLPFSLPLFCWKCQFSEKQGDHQQQGTLVTPWEQEYKELSCDYLKQLQHSLIEIWTVRVSEYKRWYMTAFCTVGCPTEFTLTFGKKSIHAVEISELHTITSFTTAYS